MGKATACEGKAKRTPGQAMPCIQWPDGLMRAANVARGGMQGETAKCSAIKQVKSEGQAQLEGGGATCTWKGYVFSSASEVNLEEGGSEVGERLCVRLEDLRRGSLSLTGRLRGGSKVA